MLNTSQTELSISDLFQGNLILASPPNIYFELQHVTEDPSKSLADAAFIIEKDAALSLRLLKIVNSAFYGFPSKVASISQAITLIGTKELQNLIIGTIVIDKFSNIPDELISMHDFWARNLRCALIAKGIDHYLGKQYSDSAFICGLLHNIGQLVFFQRIPDLAKNVMLQFQALENPSDIEEIKIEKQLIGFDHFETGAALIKLWKLPDTISESIRLHAYPDNTDAFHKIASITRLADCYTKLDMDCSKIVIHSLEIPPDHMGAIIENAFDEFEDILKVFYP